MKIKQIENLSAYFDGEISKSAEIAGLLEADENAQKVFTNFQVLSAYIKHDCESYLQTIEPTISSFWPQIEKEITHQEEKLDELLQASLSKLPESLAEADLWESLNEKLDQEATVPQRAQKSYNVDGVNDFANEASQFISPRNWELALKSSFKLPAKYEELDIWDNLSSKLNSELHSEMFSENAEPAWSDKEKYYLGLSEYFDSEVSAPKAEIINDHLLVCASCRGNYLSMVKLKNTIKFALQSVAIPHHDEFWNELQGKLFPEEKAEIKFRKIGGL